MIIFHRSNFQTNSPKSFFKTETVSTGLSLFHELVLPKFKLYFSKAKAKDISYRNFKDFEEDKFNRDLKNRLLAESVEECAPFTKIFLDVLNKHAPLKKKVVLANHAQCSSSKRSYLEKVYFKERTPDPLIKSKKRKNYCRKLYKKERRKYRKS